MKWLISPKGIKRKNQECYKMLDFTFPDDIPEDDYQNSVKQKSKRTVM